MITVLRPDIAVHQEYRESSASEANVDIGRTLLKRLCSHAKSKPKRIEPDSREAFVFAMTANRVVINRDRTSPDHVAKICSY